jgi:uncharacterized membrane protein
MTRLLPRALMWVVVVALEVWLVFAVNGCLVSCDRRWSAWQSRQARKQLEQRQREAQDANKR